MSNYSCNVVLKLIQLTWNVLLTIQNLKQNFKGVMNWTCLLSMMLYDCMIN